MGETGDLDWKDNTQVSKIKRIIGSDVLIVGGFRCLHVVKFRKNSRELKFEFFRYFKNVMENEVNSIVFHSNTIYAIGPDEKSFTMLKFKNDVDMEELTFKENYGNTPSISAYSKISSIKKGEGDPTRERDNVIIFLYRFLMMKQC